MRIQARGSHRWWWLTVLPLALGLIFVFFIMPFERVGRPLAVARGKLSCGEVMLTQTFTGTPDPYHVFFYFRPTGWKDWVEYYVDDASPFWRGSVDVSPSGDSCVVTFYGTNELAFSCAERRLGRRHKQDTLPVAMVADPFLRDYRRRVDAKGVREVRAQLDLLEGEK